MSVNLPKPNKFYVFFFRWRTFVLHSTFWMEQKLDRWNNNWAIDKENLVACSRLQLSSSYFEINTSQQSPTTTTMDDLSYIYTFLFIYFFDEFSYIKAYTRRRRLFDMCTNMNGEQKKAVLCCDECGRRLGELRRRCFVFPMLLLYWCRCGIRRKWWKFPGNSLKFIGRASSLSGYRQNESMWMYFCCYPIHFYIGIGFLGETWLAEGFIFRLAWIWIDYVSLYDLDDLLFFCFVLFCLVKKKKIIRSCTK